MLFVVSKENFKMLKYHTFSNKVLVHSIICSKCKNEDEKTFKEEESIEKSKNHGLIKNITLKIWLKKTKPRI